MESFFGKLRVCKRGGVEKVEPDKYIKSVAGFDPSFRIVENNKVGSDPNAMPEFRLRGDVQLNPTVPMILQMLMEIIPIVPICLCLF